MDEVRILKEKVISQQKEKDEEIAELKSSLKGKHQYNKYDIKDRFILYLNHYSLYQ